MATRESKFVALAIIGVCALAIIGTADVWMQLFSALSTRLGVDDTRVPPQLRKIGVRKDALGLTRKVFLQNAAKGFSINDIAVGAFVDQPDQAILWVDSAGAQVRSLSGELLRRVKFEQQMWFPKIYRYGEGHDDWIAADEGQWGGIRATSSSGKLIWSRVGNGRWLGLAAGNLDGDRFPEFVIYERGARGLEILDHDGTVLRKVDTRDPVTHMFIASVKGTPQIHYSTGDRVLVSIGVDGHEISRVPIDVAELHYMVPVHWPAGSSEPTFLQTNWDLHHFLTLTGRQVASLQSPTLRGEVCWMPTRWTVARFAGKSGSYFAMLLRVHGSPRSVFQIFDEFAALVYDEVLEGEYAGLAVIPTASGEVDRILVGGKKELLSYAPSRPGSVTASLR